MDALKAHVAQMAKLFAIDEIKVDVTQMANSDTAEQNCHDPDFELHQATSHGNALIAKSLVSMTGAQSYINYTDGDGCTPLFKAACNGHANIVTQLISARFSINFVTTKGWTPLFVAVKKGHADIVTHLIANRSNIDCPTTISGATPIFTVAENGHVAVVSEDGRKGAHYCGEHAHSRAL